MASTLNPERVVTPSRIALAEVPTAAAPVQRTRMAWAPALAALALATVWILVVYWQTGLGMVQIWSRSDTFAHGFTVLPIALWLAWRERNVLAMLVPRPAPWALVLLAGAGLAWLLGQLAEVNALRQLALVSMVVAAVPAVLGIAVTRVVAFPLAFLFFAVPIGEFVMPQLMEWTADFTVVALRASGIPVYREGLVFVIPSGTWSVVEACSGVRYLIASLMIGTLYAHLSYRSRARRWLFIGLSIVVPVVANWMRAYLIVLLGHVSGNKLATGVDHLIYGWLFFGIVMTVMLWIGGLFREDGSQTLPSAGVRMRDAGSALPTSSQSISPQLTHAQSIHSHLAYASPAQAPSIIGQSSSSRLTRLQSRYWMSAVGVIAITGVWALAQERLDRNESASAVAVSRLLPAPGWTPVSDPITQWTPHFEAPSAQLQATFAQGAHAVGIYIAYYRQQEATRKLVNSNNVLVRSEDRDFRRLRAGSRVVAIGNQPLTVRTAEIATVQTGARLVAWQWYWIDGHLTASDTLAKAYTAWARLTDRRDDSAAIVLYSAAEPSSAAVEALQQFMQANGPSILAALSATREQQ